MRHHVCHLFSPDLAFADSDFPKHGLCQAKALPGYADAGGFRRGGAARKIVTYASSLARRVHKGDSNICRSGWPISAFPGGGGVARSVLGIERTPQKSGSGEEAGMKRALQPLMAFATGEPRSLPAFPHAADKQQPIFGALAAPLPCRGRLN